MNGLVIIHLFRCDVVAKPDAIVECRIPGAAATKDEARSLAKLVAGLKGAKAMQQDLTCVVIQPAIPP